MRAQNAGWNQQRCDVDNSMAGRDCRVRTDQAVHENHGPNGPSYTYQLQLEVTVRSILMLQYELSLFEI